jgi:restriction endonuclease S subunit
MGVMWFKTKLSKLNTDTNVRLDVKFANFIELNPENQWNCREFYVLKEVISPLNSPIFKKGGIDEVFSLIDLANIEKKGDHLINLEEVTEIGSDKCVIKNGDLVIPKIEPQKGQFFLNLEHKEYLGSTELIEYKINLEKYNPVFLYSILTSEISLKMLSFLESGKTHKRVNSDVLLKIKIPFVSISIQNEVSRKIEKIRIEIFKLINSKLQPVNIINQVFGELLGFNWEEFEAIKKEKIYKICMSGFANNIDCRMGIRFHNKAGNYLQTFLESRTNKKVKDFISEPIVLGKSVSPSNYDQEGEYYYIAMSNIKTWAFDPEECKKVSEEYALSNLNKTVKKGDIILARSGEGTIGKVALIEDEEINGIFADFTQRIRLTDFDPLCAYYYFRSDFFQYLIYIHKKGLGNNTNIFPSQIKEFPMPDWDKTKQSEIVEKIRTQLDAQKKIDRQIEIKQQEINEIVEDAIKLLSSGNKC